MSTLHLDCRSQGMMESIIADRQERYSHVEFISWNNNTLVLAYIPWCQKSVASTIIVVCGYGTITKKIIIDYESKTDYLFKYDNCAWIYSECAGIIMLSKYEYSDNCAWNIL